jgi:tryptophan synthase beta chain
MIEGYFGDYGGRFVPETLVTALDELIAVYNKAKNDSIFWGEFEALSRDFSGRPTPLFLAERLGSHRSAQDKQCPRTGSSSAENG